LKPYASIFFAFSLLPRNVKIKVHKNALCIGVKLCASHKVFESRVLRKMLGVKREKVRGGCRKLCNEELHILRYSPNVTIQGGQVMVNDMGGACSLLGEKPKIHSLEKHTV
jgi:hypothetical protein